MTNGTVLDIKPVYTSFGRAYQVKFDFDPAGGKAMSNRSGEAIDSIFSNCPGYYRPGDRVRLEYRSTTSHGEWYIIGLAKTEANNV